MAGIWNDIEPKSLSRKDRHHPWVFGYYLEAPSDRDDDHWYQLFTFRNDERTVFGKLEKLEVALDGLDAAQLATKVVVNEEFRRGLISDDPDLPRIWKRH